MEPERHTDINISQGSVATRLRSGGIIITAELAGKKMKLYIRVKCFVFF